MAIKVIKNKPIIDLENKRVINKKLIIRSIILIISKLFMRSIIVAKLDRATNMANAFQSISTTFLFIKKVYQGS